MTDRDKAVIIGCFLFASPIALGWAIGMIACNVNSIVSAATALSGSWLAFVALVLHRRWFPKPQ